MFWKKKAEPRPLGVALDELQLLLAETSLKVTRTGNALLAKHDHYTTRVEVVAPEQNDEEGLPATAVVRVSTALPAPLAQLFTDPGRRVAGNGFASLGALYADAGQILVGSRLAIHGEADVWHNLQLPLLLFTVIGTTQAVLGGMRRSLGNEAASGGESDWTSDDLARVHGYLENLCVCTVDDLGLSAEFGLSGGATSAMVGDHHTALFQLLGDQPHPDLGGGLFALLQMPHQVVDAGRLHQVCDQLNRLEMAALNLPPHFGAWTAGQRGYNPAYVSFYPNALHVANDITVNAAFWALNRAQWANAMLAALGVRA